MEDTNYIFFLFIYDNLDNIETKFIYNKLVENKLFNYVVPIPAANKQTKQYLLSNSKNVIIKRLPCILQSQKGSSPRLYHGEDIDDALKIIATLSDISDARTPIPDI